MPARKITTARKALTATRSKRAAPSYGEPVELEVPPWLTGPARLYFASFAKVLAGLNTSRVVDAAIVTQLAHAAAESERVRAEIDALPALTYTTTAQTGGSVVRPYPQIAMLEVVSKRYKSLLEACGLSPASANRAEALFGG